MDDVLKEYLQVALLAVVQGAAELLPVSSSAHVILAEKAMGLNPSHPRMIFLLVMLHTGTMGAVLVYFWPRWRRLLAPPPGAAAEGPTRFQFLKALVLATALTGVLGYGLKVLVERVVLERLMGRTEAQVEDLFQELPLIGAALFAVGLLILAAGRVEARAERPVLTGRAATWVGLVQGLCLPFRGFSRSGATISVALFCGVSRPLAEDFSFALAVILTPPVIARGVYRLVKSPDWHGREELLRQIGPGMVGLVLSFLAGLLALRLLSAALERGRWKYFGYYCLAASLVIFGAAYAGM
jgi:undecaprenyl-diphosphatase